MVYNMFLASHNSELFCKKWWLYSWNKFDDFNPILGRPKCDSTVHHYILPQMKKTLARKYMYI